MSENDRHRSVGLRQLLPSLLAVAERLQRPLNLADVLDEVLTHIRTLFGYEIASVLLLDAATRELYFKAHSGHDPRLAQTRFRIGQEGIVGWVAAQGKPYYAPDVEKDPRYVATAPGVRSEAAFPLIIDATVIGVLDVESTKEDGFPEDARVALGIFATLTALAIIRAQRDEELLRQKEDMFRLIFTNNPLPMWVYDPETLRFLEVNEAAIAHYGYSRDEFLGLRITDIRPAEDVPRLLADVSQSRPARQDSGEWRHRLKDGRIIDVLINSHVIDFTDRSGVLVVAQDITARKRAEDEVRKLNAQLEQRVVERTAELHRAKDEADRANRAKSDFLSRMSHELRTPLNAILGFAQLLEMGELSGDDRESVEHILKGGRHLLDLINEILDIARIEAGRLSLSLEPVPVKGVVRETLDLIAPLAAQREIELLSHVAETEGRYILADRQRLKQVLLNLLSNAVKYNRQGGRVDLVVQDASTEQLRILVSDTGPGIPPERIDQLFVPFERLGADQTGIEGTGLGLTLSKGLTEGMGGRLGVDSVAGQGSTFWLEFPVVDSPVEHAERAADFLPVPVELDGTRQPLLVLCIEDNLANFKLIQRLLSHRPEVRLLPAIQGALGIEMAHTHRPHLILLDLHLPDLPGGEVLRRLRASPTTRDIPVVVISADATAGQIKRLLAAGAKAYLSKPIDVRRLLELFDGFLDERGKDSQEAIVDG